MTEKKHKEVPEDIQKLLKSINDHFDKEDASVRHNQIRMWRKLKFYWNNITRIYFSEVAHDWRIPDSADNQLDQSFYDKPINVFRALLESIIAALSVTVPSIVCTPDDADNSLDLSTARAGNKICELVAKHNNVQLLWLHALYIFCTEGLVAAYTYPKSDKKYGTYKENIYKDVEETSEQKICPLCMTQLSDDALAAKEQDEFMPSDEDAELNAMLSMGVVPCPNCAAIIEPQLQTKKLIVNRLVGTTEHPKTRQCVEVYGGLNVKIPNYARSIEECPYLKYSYEVHYSQAIERFPHLRSKIAGRYKSSSTSAGGNDYYERWGRLSTQYSGEYPTDTVTISEQWFRPCAYNVLGCDEDDIEELERKYPDGCKVSYVNDLIACAENSNLDDYWTVTKNPLSDYLHHDPLGLLLVSIQDITNDLTSLVLQTIEHGIPQTFANPNVLDFKQYREVETTPGMVFPAKPASGQKVSDAFYEVKTATLSGEVQPFSQKILEAGQLVSGAMPSLFGGAAPNSSKTAAQYSMSRAQALQRLQTPWKMLTVWWKEIHSKIIPMYIKSAVEDEHYTKKDTSGNYINVFIRKAELQGKIGDVELEGNEQLPTSWSQKKDVIMQLFQGGNPVIMESLMSPENIPLIKLALGIDDFMIPGEDDRQKQYEEIQQLLMSEPIQMPPQMDPMTGMMMPGEEIPSVDVDPTVDNNGIEADICRRWAVSDAGRLAKYENPAGYKNVLLHLKRHTDIMQAMMAMQAMQQGGSAPNSGPQANQPGQVDTSKNGNQNKTSGNSKPGSAPMRGQGNADMANGRVQ